MLPNQHARRLCHHCGRFVARDKRKNTGKGHVRHHCLHGRWCSGGNARQCVNNHSISCPDCRRAKHRHAMFGEPGWPPVEELMKALSTGEPSTLASYLEKCRVVFGTDSPATRFIVKKIRESPNGANEEVVADEGQVLAMLIALHSKGDDQESRGRG